MQPNTKGSLEKVKKYDVVVVGGGAAGISCAWNAAKLGLKTLIVEKNIHLGGLITSGLVIPAMKLNHKNINTDFFEELVKTSKQKDAQITYEDGNTGWFNPELLKSVFDEMLTSVGCDILFGSTINEVVRKDGKFFLDISSGMLSQYIETNNLVDGTGNAEIFQKLNLKILNEKKENEKQSLSLRFIMSNVDCKKFCDWILKFDKDRNVTTVFNDGENLNFSTAYTWDTGRKWALEPYFNKAVEDGVLKDSDRAYFQIFSVPKAYGSVAFNCPRLVLSTNANNDDSFQVSDLIIEGRRRINRIADFCRKYLKGFENAYVSNISDMLGVRESVRVLGKRIFTAEDIITGEKPENIALASDYPIDIHSDKKDNSELTYIKHVWYLPLECLISADYDNLFAVGRCLSADFKAQAAVRTQVNCFSMGEAVAKHIKKQLI